MTDKNIPDPNEIKKDFEELIRNKYGGQVQFFSSSKPSVEEKGHNSPYDFEEEVDFDFNFSYTPKEVKTYLDKWVIKQDEAKKALSIAVCDHYNRIRELKKNPEAKNPTYSKQNILMLGPTGVGKTYLIRSIANLIGVPFVKADATRFTEAGYVGANVDDLVRDLVSKANGDIELAQYGIIYLDEADKLATSPHVAGRDVSGRGVQFGLLKLMEETEVDLRSSNDMASQLQSFMEFQKTGKLEKKLINTGHILFIVSGAFTQLNEIIKSRLHKNRIGIKSSTEKEEDEGDFFSHVTTKDLINFGYEPEFVGRLPVRVSCHELTEEDLFYILRDSEGSLVRQYEEDFSAYGIKLQFTEEGLRAIAHKAHAEKTGARGLMTVCERIFRDFKFELPSTSHRTLSVTAELVHHPKEELQRLLNSAYLQ